VQRLASTGRAASHDRSGSPGHSLVTIQTGSAACPPLYFVPGGGGSDTEFVVSARLARRLGHDVPVFGFMARGLDGVTRPHASVTAMAADYAAEILERQPNGPYFLAGECVGGLAAYELARQLRARGAEVSFLALMDTLPMSRGRYVASSLTRLGACLQSGWKGLQAPAPFTRGARAIRELHRIAITLASDCGFLGGNRHSDWTAARLVHMDRVRAAYPRTLLRHRPGRYDGPVTLLASADIGRERLLTVWRRYARGPLDSHLLPGSHMAYIRDHAHTVGDVMRAAYERARRGG
jgi:thioesterase domain-containing protein